MEATLEVSPIFTCFLRNRQHSSGWAPSLRPANQNQSKSGKSNQKSAQINLYWIQNKVSIPATIPQADKDLSNKCALPLCTFRARSNRTVSARSFDRALEQAARPTLAGSGIFRSRMSEKFHRSTSGGASQTPRATACECDIEGLPGCVRRRARAA